MIVVFGSLNVDLVFPVAALPGPGETVLGERYSLASGGKGANQAAAAARAGAATRMVGCVGEDAFADRVTADLSAAGADIGAVRRVAGPTGCAAVAVDSGGENQIVVASGANLAASADQVPDAGVAAGATVLMQLEVPPGEYWKPPVCRAKSWARVICSPGVTACWAKRNDRQATKRAPSGTTSRRSPCSRKCRKSPDATIYSKEPTSRRSTKNHPSRQSSRPRCPSELRARYPLLRRTRWSCRLLSAMAPFRRKSQRRKRSFPAARMRWK